MQEILQRRPAYDEYHHLVQELYFHSSKLQKYFRMPQKQFENLQTLPNSCSKCFNYKKTFSIVLLALVDYWYRFSVVDIGLNGPNSDSGIFRHSALRLSCWTTHSVFKKTNPWVGQIMNSYALTSLSEKKLFLLLQI